MMSKNKKVCNGDSEELGNSPSLPYDTIMYHILTRMPVDTLMRFRCVCKLWYNLTINDSQFTSLHYHRQTYRNRGFIRLLQSTDNDDDGMFKIYKSKGVVFFDIDKKEEKVFHFRRESGIFDKELFIIGSLNGLVLLSCHTESSSHHVYNPITGYSYKLPVSNEFVVKGNDRLYFHLVFDSVKKRYKILCLCARLASRGNQYFLKIVTLGTGNDSWRDVDFPRMNPCLEDGCAVFANGSFNWLTHEREILSINVSDEVFYKMKYPKECSINGSRLLEIQGSLYFLDYLDNGVQAEASQFAEVLVAYKRKLKLWILKVDDVKENSGHRYEWIKMHNFVDMLHNTTVQRKFNRSRFSPVIVAVVMHPAHKIIFGDNDEYYCYDVKLGRLDPIIKPSGMHHKWYVYEESISRL